MDRKDIAPPPRAGGVNQVGGWGAGGKTLPGCTLGSKHTIVIGGVPRLGIPENLEGYTLRSRISFKPSSPMIDA